MLLLMLVLLSFVWLPRFSMFYLRIGGNDSRRQRRRVARNLAVSLVLGAYLATTLGFRLLPYNHFAFVPWYGAATSLLFVKVCFGDNALNRFFARLPLRLVGNISYSFYLIHLVAIGCTTMWLAKYLVGLPMAASLPLFLVAAFALALVFTVALFTAGERWYFGFAQHGSAARRRRFGQQRPSLVAGTPRPPAAGGVFAALSALIAVAGFLWPGWGLLSRLPGKQELLWSLGKQGRTQFEFDLRWRCRAGIRIRGRGPPHLHPRRIRGQMDGGQPPWTLRKNLSPAIISRCVPNAPPTAAARMCNSAFSTVATRARRAGSGATGGEVGVRVYRGQP